MPNNVCRNRSEESNDMGEDEVVAVVRQIYLEQEELSAALSEMLRRGERLGIRDLKVVQRLASRDSRESAELAALSGNVRSRWQKRWYAMGEAGRIARATHKNRSR